MTPDPVAIFCTATLAFAAAYSLAMLAEFIPHLVGVSVALVVAALLVGVVLKGTRGAK